MGRPVLQTGIVRTRPALVRLLVLLLLVQWGTAFGHCLKLTTPGGVLRMDICTPDGIRSIDLALDEHEQPAAEHAMGMICPVCAGIGGGAPPPPPVALVPPVLLTQAEAPSPPSTPSPAPPPRGPPQPRAPPIA